MKALSLTVCLTLAAMTGYAMFHITFEVERLEAELRDVKKLTAKERDDIHHLRAEWSYLNRPDRLAELAKKLLPGWNVPKTNQITRIDQLSEKIARSKAEAARTTAHIASKEHRLKKPERQRYAEH
jgi:hypothetical protein